MKIIYYLKNLKITKVPLAFLNKRLRGLNKFFKKEEVIVEVELSKDQETRAKGGPYKAKIILDLPKKSLIVAQGVGKNVFQAINDGLKKLKRQLRRKP